MSFDFGSFAGGVSKAWDSKAIGGAINQGMLNRDVQAAEDKAKEGRAALEHLRKAGETAGKAIQTFDEKGNPQTVKSRAIDTYDGKLDWSTQQSRRVESDRTQAIKEAYTKWKSPEAYNNYLKSEAEGSKASFEKYITDGKMAFAQELRDLRGNKAAMVQKAIEMGELPKGSVFDEKSGQVMVPGQNGRMQVMPIDDSAINGFMDKYELQGWRRFGTGIDDYLKGQQAEVALATKGDQIAAAGLKNDKTRAEINFLKEKGAAAREAAKGGGKGGTGKPGKHTYLDLQDGSKLQLGPDGTPTGMALSPQGALYETDFGSSQAYQEAVSKGQELGIQRIVDQNSGEAAFAVGGKVYPNYFTAYKYASTRAGQKKGKSGKQAIPLSKEDQAKMSKANKAQRAALESDSDAQQAKTAAMSIKNPFAKKLAIPVNVSEDN